MAKAACLCRLKELNVPMSRMRSVLSLRTPDYPDCFLPDLCTSKAVLLLVLVAELFVMVLVLAMSKQRFDWNYLALTSLFVQWIVLACAALLCRLRQRISQRSTPIITLVCVILCVIITLLFTQGAEYFFYRLASNTNILIINGWLLLRNSLIATIVTGILLRYFYLQKELGRHQQAELKARIQSLQSRIHPHFLFNSMNSIASLIHIDPDKAEQVVEDLSDLFRASLAEAGVEISMKQEIELSKRYVSIEKYRFGERLTVDWNIEEFPDDLLIPQLTLQPLLENAILHGIQPDPDPGTVTVDIAYRHHCLEIEIGNTLVRDKGHSSANLHIGNSVALDNIAARLAALYGDNARLQTSTEARDDRCWFKAQITYPWP